MNRPYIFCHMITSIDGKIDGPHKQLPERQASAQYFYNLTFGKDSYYQIEGWLSGRATTDAAFTHNKQPDVDENAALVPEGDYIVETNLPKYYVSVDPSGKLGWESNSIQYRDTNAHVIEVLTEKASNAYKAMLRKLNISYIIVGKDALDYALLMEKLKNLFHIETLMLGGGAVLNWSFIQEGLCDEVSIVIAPFADGSVSAASLFETKDGLSEDNPVSFDLENVESREDGTVWLRYKVKS